METGLANIVSKKPVVFGALSLFSPRILRQLALLLCALLLTASLAAGGNHHSKINERRLSVGLALYPNLVSIDLNLSAKKTASGSLVLLIVYNQDRKTAFQNQEKLREQVQTIQKNPVEIHVVSVQELRQNSTLYPAGIFLCEELDATSMGKVRRFAETRHCLLFSPFENALQQGVMIGIRITSKIKPVINMKSLEKSAVKLHKLFLQSAEKRYE